MKVENPENGETYYFVDKCLPFGHSISCSHFQRFSNALKHILEWKTGKKWVVNYLDDFLFIAASKEDCDDMMKVFIQLCKDLGVPIAMEKTEYGSERVVFLGILLEGKFHILSVPEEKRVRAVNMLKLFINKKKSLGQSTLDVLLREECTPS